MLIGLVGAPNKGKSTIFSALTLNEVGIADYPFTTINPNIGITYATKQCIEQELHVKCNARNSLCESGIRKLPINIIDVAGLVEGAHEGKGMGNQFLSDLSSADALVIVVDASGETDAFGNMCDNCDPSNDVTMIKEELAQWIASIIKKHMNFLSKRKDRIDAFSEILSGLKINKYELKSAMLKSDLPEFINWSDSEIETFSKELLLQSKMMVIAANKSDKKDSEKNLNVLKSEFGEDNVIAVSGAVELALRKADSKKIIDYIPGSKGFKILEKNISEEQFKALEYMSKYLKEKGTNIQQLLNHIVFDLSNCIVVYPVEDENKFTDNFGNVLPDAILLKMGSTAFDLAESIHTQIAKNMLYAVDAKNKRRLGKDYVLKDNDVIKIVSASK